MPRRMPMPDALLADQVRRAHVGRPSGDAAEVGEHLPNQVGLAP